jgi:two-component system response regulator RegX3
MVGKPWCSGFTLRLRKSLREGRNVEAMHSEAREEKGASVLVVEDEDAIRRGLCDVLVYHGHAPTEVTTGEEGLAAALAHEWGLVLLDVMLPGRSGFDVCRELRAAGRGMPVLMLTARGAEEDILEGFRCGADDYVTKPFSVAELVARVEALLRRSAHGEGDALDARRLDFGAWKVDVAGLEAERDGRRVELTRRETELIGLLVAEPGHIVSRRRLLRELWGFPDPDRVETRTVDMHIAKLRKKLSPDAVSLIETVRGEGYRYRG